MTYPAAYGPPAIEPPPRPQPVTIAAMILMLSTLANFGMGMFIAFKTLQYAGDNEGSPQRVYAILLGLFAVGLGGAFAALSVGILRGGSVSRILVFVACGLVACCGGLSAVGLVVIMQQDGIEEPAQLVATILAFTNVVMAPLTGILLTLPSASQWFRDVDSARKGHAHHNSPGRYN